MSEHPTGLTLDLAAFEGPLDLLLHLIKELKVDIFDIPINLVTEQYLVYIHTYEDLSLDIASEYLVMAATLLEIKTKMMLPKTPKLDDEEDEGDDPREGLVEQLLAFQQYQEVSHILAEKQSERALEYTKTPSDLSQYQKKIPMTGRQLTSDDLYRALQKMAFRLKNQQPIKTTIANDGYSVNTAMADIRQAFVDADKQILMFQETIFTKKIQTKGQIVTLFLAILELVKSNELYLYQEDLKSDIQLIRREESE